MDDENGLQTQIRRWHLTVERPMSDKIIPSNIVEEKQWNKLTSGPSRHPSENKDFCALQRTHQFPGNMIITQRARGFNRLIVVDQRSPVSTIDVGGNGERALELVLA